jgi:hypothetical protein
VLVVNCALFALQNELEQHITTAEKLKCQLLTLQNILMDGMLVGTLPPLVNFSREYLCSHTLLYKGMLVQPHPPMQGNTCAATPSYAREYLCSHTLLCKGMLVQPHPPMQGNACAAIPSYANSDADDLHGYIPGKSEPSVLYKRL